MKLYIILLVTFIKGSICGVVEIHFKPFPFFITSETKLLFYICDFSDEKENVLFTLYLTSITVNPYYTCSKDPKLSAIPISEMSDSLAS